ncbi:hypothetical protein ACYT84_08955 [Ralstonia solanacearum]
MLDSKERSSLVFVVLYCTVSFRFAMNMHEDNRGSPSSATFQGALIAAPIAAALAISGCTLQPGYAAPERRCHQPF